MPWWVGSMELVNNGHYWWPDLLDLEAERAHINILIRRPTRHARQIETRACTSRETQIAACLSCPLASARSALDHMHDRKVFEPELEVLRSKRCGNKPCLLIFFLQIEGSLWLCAGHRKRCRTLHRRLARSSPSSAENLSRVVASY